MPEELYHYTNIESLALILKNRTIRFNSLDKMDDLQETMTADVENAGRFTYVSCWTADVKENIALWDHQIYIRSRNSDGVKAVTLLLKKSRTFRVTI